MDKTKRRFIVSFLINFLATSAFVLEPVSGVPLNRITLVFNTAFAFFWAFSWMVIFLEFRRLNNRIKKLEREVEYEKPVEEKEVGTLVNN